MKITVAECAELLNGSEAWVRSLVSRGLIGDRWSSVWNVQYHTAPQRFKYEIVPSKLANFMEISEQELLNRLIVVRESEVR